MLLMPSQREIFSLAVLSSDSGSGGARSPTVKLSLCVHKFMGTKGWGAISRRWGRWWRWLGMALAGWGLTLQGWSAIAQAPQPSAPASDTGVAIAQPLEIGVSPRPPFVIQSSSAQPGSDWDGIGVDLWRKVAYELNLDYQWREVEPSQAIAQLQSGTLDVALMTATAPRSQQVDFSQSYFATTLGIATQRQQRFWEVTKSVLSLQFLRICLWLSLLLVVVGLICWLFERRSNDDMFNKSPRQGIWDGFWWAGVTMTTIGYGDKAPKTTGGRLLALLWMLIAMGITASLTARITSILVLDQGIQPLQVQQLKTMAIGSLANTTAANYLQQEQLNFQTFSTPEAGLQAVTEGRIDAFVGGTTTLRSLNQDSFQERLQIDDTGIQTNLHAFALPKNSALQAPLNQQLLLEMSEPGWQDLLQRYLPQSQ